MTAYTIDMFIGTILSLVAFYLFVTVMFFTMQKQLFILIDKIDPTITYYSSLAAYFLFQEMFWHKTIGKKLVKIEIVNKDGGKPRIYQVIIRNIFKVIDNNNSNRYGVGFYR